MTDYICYCFEYTEADIIEDVQKNNGRSTIIERIISETRSGNCQCRTKNPKGTWCLADVRRVADSGAPINKKMVS